MSNYYEYLKRNICEAKNTEFISKREYTIWIAAGERFNNECEEVISELKDCENVIYRIKQIGGDISQTIEALKKRKTDNRYPLALPKINDSGSETLYVGSSVNKFGARLRLHLGANSPRTYALHLSEWFQGSISLTVWQYDLKISRDVLQLIEDNLSFESKPSFGKMGANNR